MAFHRKEGKMLILLLTPIYLLMLRFHFGLGPKAPDETVSVSMTKVGVRTPQRRMKRALDSIRQCAECFHQQKST